MIVTTRARRRALAEWFRAAEVVVDLTEDAEAVSVLTFLQASAFLAEPRSGGAVVSLDDAHGAYPVAVIPLLAEDANLEFPWSMKLRQTASFNPGIPALFLSRHEHVSQIWRGILVLHEGHHARTFLLDPYDWTHEPTYFAKERDTHIFQNRLVSILGGSVYRDALQQDMDRFRSSLRGEGHRAGEKFMVQVDCPEHFDQIFGPPVSEAEVAIRKAHWLVHVNFTLIERDLGDGPSARECQRRCIEELHRLHRDVPPALEPSAVDAVLESGLEFS